MYSIEKKKQQEAYLHHIRVIYEVCAVISSRKTRQKNLKITKNMPAIL